MTKPIVPLTAEQLRAAVSYDPETGIFTRIVRASRIAAGTIAGHVTFHGYLVFHVRGVEYFSHRLAWLYVFDRWPMAQIDHIDGNRTNNRIANLREATNSINHQNMRKARTDNVSSGLLGVYAYNHGGARWRAQIFFDGRHHHLGIFSTPQEAHAAYVEAKRRFHEGCTI